MIRAFFRLSIVQITSPTANVSPSSAISSLITPVKEDGISAFTLSVLLLQVDHICLLYHHGLTSHFSIVPSVTLSPS